MTSEQSEWLPGRVKCLAPIFDFHKLPYHRTRKLQLFEMFLRLIAQSLPPQKNTKRMSGIVQDPDRFFKRMPSSMLHVTHKYLGNQRRSGGVIVLSKISWTTHENMWLLMKTEIYSSSDQQIPYQKTGFTNKSFET